MSKLSWGRTIVSSNKKRSSPQIPKNNPISNNKDYTYFCKNEDLFNETNVGLQDPINILYKNKKGVL